ncbi:MAG TPA: hypothetical protein VGI58_21630 [Streptosporangiaceae bacterium]|jgi:hypothetical protein
MPTHDQTDETPEFADSPVTEEERNHLSRRSVLRRAAGVGTVGLAVAVGGSAAAAALSSRSHGNTSTAQSADVTRVAGSGPIVIYLADPRSGEMDIFAGTGQTHHTNRAMAAMVASMAPGR